MCASKRWKRWNAATVAAAVQNNSRYSHRNHTKPHANWWRTIIPSISIPMTIDWASSRRYSKSQKAAIRSYLPRHRIVRRAIRISRTSPPTPATCPHQMIPIAFSSAHRKIFAVVSHRSTHNRRSTVVRRPTCPPNIRSICKIKRDASYRRWRPNVMNMKRNSPHSWAKVSIEWTVPVVSWCRWQRHQISIRNRTPHRTIVIRCDDCHRWRREISNSHQWPKHFNHYKIHLTTATRAVIQRRVRCQLLRFPYTIQSIPNEICTMERRCWAHFKVD